MKKSAAHIFFQFSPKPKEKVIKIQNQEGKNEQGGRDFSNEAAIHVTSGSTDLRN